MNQFQKAFHSKIQILASLNESIVNSHFPNGSNHPSLCSTPSRGLKKPGSLEAGPTTTTGSSASAGNQETAAMVETASERGLPRIYPKLPLEVLELVFSDLSKPELIPVLQSNRSLYSVAIRLFYRVLVENDAARCVALVKRVLAMPALYPHVRVVEFNLSTVEALTGNFYRLLQRFLRCLSGLTSLTLDLPKVNSPVWIFDGCRFSLRVLSTSMQCSGPLAKFLDSQSNIRTLTLRGFQSDALQAIPLFGLDIANNPSLLFTPRRNFDDFVLQPASLPKLTSFNAIHAGPPVVATVARGRPLTIASVPLFSSSALASLDALNGSSAQLKRLSVISFDPEAPAFIFEEVAKRFPSLEALHIVVLLAEFTPGLLLAACPHLQVFKKLKYITCVATSPESSSLLEEQEIAQKWHQHCPSLQTIILPKGRVWFQANAAPPKRGRAWTCFDEDEDNHE
ncbi:hypothetical protein FA15DRAFT_69592 [Coprinopsis marcescibilis]|uniref:F-box domain-containing protein n=1 Tax=Coprinopsis marcescibilis TaxID=230819 RepID=A0A5C3KN60_COPMA|nr:hypothetical protein FA15DRAFT_69592 [Coprinopsis marcescibilis]